MEKLSKQVIKEILRTDLSQEISPLGEKLACVLFKRGKLAMSVQVDGRGEEILLPAALSQHLVQKVLLDLTDLIATLSYLEKSRLIILVKLETPFTGVFYEGSDKFEGGQLPHVFHLSNDLTLTTKTNEATRLMENKELVLEGCSVAEAISKPLAYFLCNMVMPTQALKEYVDRNYKTREEQLTRRGLRYSVISMILAVIVAAVSPIGTVWIVNKHGVSTIRQEQFDSLLHTARPVRIVTDTIAMNNFFERKDGNEK